MSPGKPQQTLQDVLHNPAIWRARQLARDQERGLHPVVATTHAALDRALPDGGWPLGALTELLLRASGVGEVSLLLPALRAACAEGRGLALLAPPWLPQARAWESAGIALERMLVIEARGSDLLWSAEQILRSGECGAVLLWAQAAGRALDHRALQRLHLAASAGRALCFLYRSFGAAAHPSPAPLRLKLAPRAGALQVEIFKCRAAPRAQSTALRLFPAHWEPAETTPAPLAQGLSVLHVQGRDA